MLPEAPARCLHETGRRGRRPAAAGGAAAVRMPFRPVPAPPRRKMRRALGAGRL